MLRRVVLGLALLTIQVIAADPFYIGKWKIVSAVVAPWWEDPTRKPDAAGIRAFVGKTITISVKAIEGPGIFACKKTQYKISDYPADFLFQGAFGEMQIRNKTVDPAAIAASLGFRGSSWKTLETGCEAEIDYHFLDPATAAIGLDNYVYTLRKQ
jgi:hypothetical protein